MIFSVFITTCFVTLLLLVLPGIKQKRVSTVELEVDNDFEDAIDALISLGYRKEDAERRVIVARHKNPSCSYHKLVNAAVRGNEDDNR